MYAKSLALVAALALASKGAAKPERPRFYYPQHVRREIINTTITSADTLPPAENTPSSSSELKRDTLSDFISSVLYGQPHKDPTSVTTVVRKQTIYVTPTSDATPTKPNPVVGVKPTTSSDGLSAASQAQQPTDDEGIVVAPTGILLPDTSSSSSSSVILPTDSSSGASANSTTPSSTSTKAAATSGSSTSTSAISTPATTSAPASTTGGGLLDPINSVLTSLLPDPAPTANSTSAAATSPSTSAAKSTASSSATEAYPTTSASTKAPATSDGGLLPSILPSVTLSLPPLLPTTTAPVSETTVPSNTTAPEVPSTTSDLLSIIPTILPPVTTTSDPPVVNATSTGAPTGTASVTTVPTGSVTDVPVTNSTATQTGPVSTSLPATSDLPETSTIGNSTSIPTSVTGSPVTSLPTTSPAGNSTFTPVTTSAAQSASSTSSGEPVTSIRPTATFTNTGGWLPTTIVIEPTSMSYSAPTVSATATTTIALPTGLPKIILPDNPNTPAPEGTVAIQIGFLYPLNYLFVSSNTVAAAQIFTYLPKALADAGGFSQDKVQVSKLVPFDTREQWGYITTIAKLNYPSNLVDKLQMDLWSPNSALYNDADPIVRNLTALINPKIDLFGNVNDGTSTGGLGGGAAPSPSSGAGNDAFGSNPQDNPSAKSQRTTAAIAVGAVGLSAMYGAAMFIVARRYKRKRQAHRRSGSVDGSQPEMRFNGNGSPALMGGALLSRDVSSYGGFAGGRYSHGSGTSSARTANISAPVAAENSLGWN